MKARQTIVKVENLRVLAVTNMFPTPGDPTSGTFVEQQVKGLIDIGLDVRVLVVDRAHGGMREYLKLGQRIRKTCVEFGPDIVHSMYGGVMADVVVRTVEDTPTVVSFCGSDLLGELLSGTIRKLVSGFGVLASRRAARKASGIVVKSKNLQDALPSDVSLTKIRIIPNGIDLDRFKPLDRDVCRKRLGWQRDTLHILFPTNSGDPRKRIGLALAATEAVNRLGLKADLHQLRGVAHQDVPIWLNASDVVLLTSLHEGSPNVIKEALACDLPIVSVDVGDVRERIQGIEGCYISLPTPTDLAAKLSLVNDSPRRVAGRITMHELSLEQIGLRLGKFYSELLYGLPLVSWTS